MSEVNEFFGESDLPRIAEKIITDNPDTRLFAFYGKMGVGKTTLIKEICDFLKVKDTVTSPTFSIVNQYITRNDELVYHFDFYRLRTINELYDIGYEEYFYSNHYCFLEWPEKVESLLPEETLRIYMEEENEVRNIKYSIVNLH